MDAKVEFPDVAVPAALKYLVDDRSPLLVAVKTPAGEFVHANAALEELYGAAHGGLVGRFDADYLDPGSADRVADHDAAALAVDDPSYGLDDLAIDGRTHPVASVRFPYADAAGRRVLLYAGILIQGDETDAANAFALRTMLALKEQLRCAERDAAMDRLTGAFNRAYFEDLGRNELVRLQRYGHPLSLLFMDLDGLKRVNDTAGHREGDAYLRSFCDEVRAACRVTDRLGRFGGDEFVLLLPNTPIAGAAQFAARIRDRLVARTGVAPSPAASIGVVAARASETWEALVERADAAMYRAKRRGPNNVEVDRPAGEDDADEVGAAVDLTFVRLIWQSAYESGNPIIDAQHRGLFANANALLAAATNNAPRDEALPLVERLVDDVHAHFAYEESVLARIGFPGASRHAEGHARLLAKAEQLAANVRGGHASASSTLDFLVHQLVGQHLLKADRAFFPYLRNLAADASEVLSDASG